MFVAACGAGMTPSAARDVPFTEVASTQMSSYEGDAAVLVGTSDATRARITAAVRGATAAADRVLVAAFQGDQRTGGFAIHIERIERDGGLIVVHAAFTAPAPGGIVTQVLTSPAHVVAIGASDVRGAKTIVLVDATGTERARADVT